MGKKKEEKDGWVQVDPNKSADDLIDEIMNNLTDSPELDDPNEELDPLFEPIDIDEIDSEAKSFSNLIATRLSGYYFDQEYIDNHPYIPVKIMMEMDNIRRLLKMVSITERAQDILVKSISTSPTKGALFLSLDRMQSSALHIQKQLNDLVTNLEDVFRQMQDECEIKWTDREKEELNDGTITTRGSKEFIEKILAERDKYRQIKAEQNNNVS